MLRTSPHNEGFILVVGHSERDLAYIAEQYVLELYGHEDWIESKVNLKEETVEVWHGEHTDEEGVSQTFYISKVEVL
jgi:hypothetical protein